MIDDSQLIVQTVGGKGGDCFNMSISRISLYHFNGSYRLVLYEGFKRFEKAQ
jgi:hypothetical protein